MKAGFAGSEAIILLLIHVILSGCQGEQNVTLTVNTTSSDGLLCPEVAKWTCNVTTDSIARITLRTNNSTVTFPGSNVTDFNYDFMNMDLGQYAIGTLIVNNAELYNLGYSHLTCGTLAKTANHSLTLNKEEPRSPQVLSVKFFINETDTITSEMTVSSMIYNYSSDCKYKRNSYFTTFFLAGGTAQHHTNTLLNSSDCNESLCIIRATFPRTLLSSSPSIVIKSVNEFTQSLPYSNNLPALSGFNFTFTSEECGLVALCTSSLALHNNTCIVSYRRSNETKTIEAHIPVNKNYLFHLTLDTKYQINVTFNTGNETVHLMKMLTPSKRDLQCNIEASQIGLILIIVSVGVLFLALIFCVIGCLACARAYSKNDKEESSTVANIHSELPPSLSLEEMKLSNNFDVLGGQTSFNITKSDSFESATGNAIPTVQVTHRLDPYQDTRSYNTLEKNAVMLEDNEMKETQINEHYILEGSANPLDALQQPFIYNSLENTCQDGTNVEYTEIDVTTQANSSSKDEGQHEYESVEL